MQGVAHRAAGYGASVTTTPARRDVGPPGVDSDEKSTLPAFLNYLRDAVTAKARGLADEQGRAAAVPSGTSILGLVKHVTAAEVYWFAWAFEGAGSAPPDLSMELAEGDSAESLARGAGVFCARPREARLWYQAAAITMGRPTLMARPGGLRGGTCR